MMLRQVPGQVPLAGTLRYVESEHSFAFDVGSPVELQDRVGGAGVTSLSVGTLQVEVGIESELVLFVWGLHPSTNWKREFVGQPKPTLAGVRVESAQSLRRGVSLSLAAVGAWDTSFDEKSGWVRIARDPTCASAVEVSVATGVVLGVTDGQLDSMWLQPVFE